MAALILVSATTDERFSISDIDFAVVTPRDILSALIDFEIPSPPQDAKWVLLKDGTVVDENKSLENLGLKDGDKLQITVKTGSNP